MKVTKTMRAGTKGTRKFVTEWGEKLLNVRYRETSTQLLTTIEIVVDKRKKPPSRSLYGYNAETVRRNREVVAVRIFFREEEMRAKLRRIGARWSDELKLWLITYEKAVRLGITERIQKGKAKECTDVDTSFII